MTKQCVIIAGGRNFNDSNLVRTTLLSLVESGWLSPDPVILSGLASGADTIAIEMANEFNLELWKYPAKWTDMSEPCVIGHNQYGTYNMLAGHKRNGEMANDACTLIAFWDGKSRGTKDMIDKMTSLGKRVHTVKY